MNWIGQLTGGLVQDGAPTGSHGAPTGSHRAQRRRASAALSGRRALQLGALTGIWTPFVSKPQTTLPLLALWASLLGRNLRSGCSHSSLSRKLLRPRGTQLPASGSFEHRLHYWPWLRALFACPASFSGIKREEIDLIWNRGNFD